MTALAPRPRPDASAVDALVDAAIDGDERAWETICERHLPQVRAVATARLRDGHAAEDVVQETFVIAWTRLHQLRDVDRLGPWLTTIAANLATDHVRRQRRTAPLEAALRTVAPGPSHDDVVVAKEEAAVLHGHLEQLREVDRRALWQRDGHGVPVSEVAAQLGMTAGSVRVLLTRARKRVRDGYGVVAAPVLPLLERWRHRMAGLGDAVPVAVAAPAVVVAVVVGVAGSTLQEPSSPTPAPTTSIAVAPGPTPVAGATTAPLPPPTPASPQRRVMPTDPAPTAAPAQAEPAAEPDPPRVELGQESAAFADEPPTADDRDADAEAPAGPVDGLEVYLEETGIVELGGDCTVC